MGRYYTTNTGRDGKFGFGCQSSTDPGDYFGMHEGQRIIYIADEDDAKNIKSKLDKIYDEAGVPQEERTYCLDGSGDEYDDFHNRYHKYFFEACKPGEGDFASEDGGVARETYNGAHLGQSRLWLGLTILSDIKEQGYCELEAEL